MIRRALATVVLTLLAAGAHAEVTRVDVARRADVGATGYEKIVGTVHFALDPADAANRVIVHLDRAPRNAAGKVAFSADLYILRPRDAARSNGIALIDVLNRGRKLALTYFNRMGALDPATEADLGDGFLMKQGYTLVWVGWQFDVQRRNDLMGIDAPIATGVTGVVRAEFTPNDRSPETTVADLAGYPPADPAAADTTLTVRDGAYGNRRSIPRSKFQVKGNVVSMDGGFEPGRTYELSYRTERVPVSGVGLAAFRDTASWLRYDAAAPAPARHTIAFGSSQSGRFLRTFLYQGFNTDERGRQVFDGVMAHIAGGARLSLNEPSATPNSLGFYSATSFPYADAALRDPVRGHTDGLLEKSRARGHAPKVFYTNSSVEYWGGGRAAALVHSSPDGRWNQALPENVRAYLFAGTQHSPGQFPPRKPVAQTQPDNPVQYGWPMRALLVAMTKWVADGVAPPPSQHPQYKQEGSTIVAAAEIPFPRIPGVQSPRIVTPGRDGERVLPLLVSQVDADGNEIAGIRLPDVSVPLATYTGWNFRSPEVGGTRDLVSLTGSSIAFPATRAAREASGDPRRSIEERYASKDDYLRRVREAADALVKDRYLLADDVSAILERSGEMWDYFSRQTSVDRRQSARD
jgi:hypothetical protein